MVEQLFKVDIKFCKQNTAMLIQLRGFCAHETNESANPNQLLFGEN